MGRTHSHIKSSIDAERGLLRREGFAGVQDFILVPRTCFLVADVAQSLLAAQRRVVWLTHCEEVRGQVPSDYLACIDKNIHSKETESVDPCKEEETVRGLALMIIEMLISASVSTADY